MCAVQVCIEKNKKGYEFKLEMAEKKNMQKKKGIYFRHSESLTYNGEIPGRRVVSGLADILFYYQSPSQIHTITRSCVLLNWANWRTRASLKGRAIVTGVWKASRLRGF